MSKPINYIPIRQRYTPVARNIALTEELKGFAKTSVINVKAHFYACDGSFRGLEEFLNIT
jgi:hypothetical protein